MYPKRKPAKLLVISYYMQPLQWVNSLEYLEITFSGSNNLIYEWHDMSTSNQITDTYRHACAKTSACVSKSHI